jgi:transcriptional regulator with XRE-family HTH domain
VPEAEYDWKRLADYVQARRRNQGLRSREAFAAKSGVSPRTLGALERGMSVSKGTLLAVDSALMWVAGSCERILTGGDPVLWPQHAPGFWADGDGDVTEENPRSEGEVDPTSVSADADDADELVFRLRVPPNATPRQREIALRAAEASARAVLAELDAEE